MDASEEDRRGIEALAIGDETGGDVSSGNFTSGPSLPFTKFRQTRHFPLLVNFTCIRPRSW
jgi:hypothetical protein